MSVVGLDIGGTNVRLVAASADGRVLARRTMPTLAERGPRDALDRIVAAVGAIAREAGGRPAAIGVGVTGPVDPATGVVDNPYTLGGWPPTDLRGPLEGAFAVPVAIDNDANVAAVGEWWVGAARGFRRVAMVTIGTGVGVAALLEGRLQRAVDGRHGEAGHMLLDPAGPECYCGARGCWEALASGTALGRRGREAARASGGVLLDLAAGEPDAVDGPMVFAADAAGDPVARALVDDAAGWIGAGLVNLACVLTPDVVVLAGGVARHTERLRPRIEAVLAAHRVMIPTDVPVRAATLGEDAGPMGAARLALDLSA